MQEGWDHPLKILAGTRCALQTIPEDGTKTYESVYRSQPVG